MRTGASPGTGLSRYPTKNRHRYFERGRAKGGGGGREKGRGRWRLDAGGGLKGTRTMELGWPGQSGGRVKQVGTVGGWVGRRRGGRSGRMQGAINSEIALARSLLDANIGALQTHIHMQSRYDCKSTRVLHTRVKHSLFLSRKKRGGMKGRGEDAVGRMTRRVTTTA